MDLETWFQIHTNVSNFEMRPQKPYELSKFFSFVIYLKIDKNRNSQFRFIEMVVM